MTQSSVSVPDLKGPDKLDKQAVTSHYLGAIILISINTLLLYFYYNCFAPILTPMARDFGFSDEERDRLIGTVPGRGIMDRESI